MASYGYIYKTTNVNNNKVYLGQNKGDFDPKYFGSGIVLRNAIKKNGYIHFKLEVIAWAKSKEELDKLERYYIAEARKLLSPMKVYNIADGGEGGSGQSKEKHHMWGKHWSEEHNKRISLQTSGKNSKLYIPRETRTCACGCGETFECRPKILKRYVNGHTGRGKSYNAGINSPCFGRIGTKHPMFGKPHPSRIKSEIRICICGCNKQFECKINSIQQFIHGHHAHRSRPDLRLRMLGIKRGPYKKKLEVK